MEEFKDKVVDYIYSDNRTLDKDYDVIIKLYNKLLELEEKLEQLEKDNEN